MKTTGLNNRLVDWIKKRDEYDYSILTNCPGDFSKKLKELDLENVFKAVVNPENSFLRKPQKEAYTKILREIGSKPEEVVFIDDSPTNVQAGNRLGIESILYKDNKTLFKELKNIL